MTWNGNWVAKIRDWSAICAYLRKKPNPATSLPGTRTLRA
jgi:hypothetical protein